MKVAEQSAIIRQKKKRKTAKERQPTEMKGRKKRREATDRCYWNKG